MHGSFHRTTEIVAAPRADGSSLRHGDRVGRFEVFAISLRDDGEIFATLRDPRTLEAFSVRPDETLDAARFA